jgi:hypothetical protein
MLRLSALACLLLCGLAVASAADPYYVKFEVYLRCRGRCAARASIRGEQDERTRQQPSRDHVQEEGRTQRRAGAPETARLAVAGGQS